MNGRFQLENIPWNKGKKGIHLSKKSEWKMGNIPYNFDGFYKPHMVNHSRDGIQVITTIPKKKKAFDVRRRVWYKTRVRTSFARVVMGLTSIPKGYVVYHKDGDPLNNSSFNLIVISRAELVGINSKRN